MKPSVYLETSVISYHTSKMSRDLIIAAHQQITSEWWAKWISNYHIFISDTVIQEISRGDPEAAKQRLKETSKFKRLEINSNIIDLAKTYISRIPLPKKASLDALHLALATSHGIDFLVTWNCKHIANGNVVFAFRKINEEYGFNSPIVCTPEELSED